MRKFYILITVLLIGTTAFSQCSVTVTGSTNVTCNGACDGSVSLSTVGVPPYSYSWSPGGQTVQNPNNLCAGTHTVTMTDGNSCVATTTVVITEPDMLQDSTTQNNIASCDSCNGSATVYPYGGTPGLGYSHKWSTNPVQTSATATGLCPGTYHDTITDANNCQTIATVTITQAMPLMVSTSVTDASSSTACDGGASASPSGGNGPYAYQWTPGGDTTSSIIAQCPGTYTVCVTDADGCSSCDSNVVIGVSTNIVNSTNMISKIHVFPNPSANGVLNVSFGEAFTGIKEIFVLNTLGEEVLHSTTQDQKVIIDLSSYSNGNYFIKVISDRGSFTKKILLK